MIPVTLLFIWFVVLQVLGINYFQVQSATGLIVISFVLSVFIGKRIHWSVGSSVFYFSVINSIRLVFPRVFWPEYELSEVVGFECLVTNAQLYMISIALLFAIIEESGLELFENLLSITVVVDSLVMLIKWTQGHLPYFVFNNPAIDASFLATTVPLFYHRSRNLKPILRSAIIAPVIGAIIIAKSSTGIMALGVGSALYFIVREKSYRGLAAAIAVTSICAITGYVTQGADLVHSNGRTYVWKLAFKYFIKYVDHYFGAGTGTYQMIGPALQVNDAFAHGVTDAVIPGFFWAHNDWLQILFETGAIGLVLTFTVLAIALWESRKDPAIFASLATFAIVAFTQMPIRWVLFALFGGFLLVRATKKTTSTHEREDYVNKTCDSEAHI